MSNPTEQQPSEFADLEPLKELPPEVPSAAAAEPSARAPKGPSTPSPAALAARAQEKAPQLLKKAAYILTAGSLLPWLPVSLPENAGFVNVGLKLALLLGCWLVLQGVLAHFGAATKVGFGTKSLVPDKKGLVGAINGLHVLGTLVILAGLVAQWNVLSADLKVLGESITLLLGGMTFAHITGYEKGGKFNPLFPLMFLGCALGGLASLVGGINNGKWLAVLGSAVITTAGVLAVYTIAVAMMQAKKDGDIKRAAALEARKQARVAKR
jgi:hypothetical protein